MILLYALQIYYSYLQTMVVVFLSDLQRKQSPDIGNSLMDER